VYSQHPVVSYVLSSDEQLIDRDDSSLVLGRVILANSKEPRFPRLLRSKPHGLRYRTEARKPLSGSYHGPFTVVPSLFGS